MALLFHCSKISANVSLAAVFPKIVLSHLTTIERDEPIVKSLGERKTEDPFGDIQHADKVPHRVATRRLSLKGEKKQPVKHAPKTRNNLNFTPACIYTFLQLKIQLATRNCCAKLEPFHHDLSRSRDGFQLFRLDETTGVIQMLSHAAVRIQRPPTSSLFGVKWFQILLFQAVISATVDGGFPVLSWFN